MRCFELSSILFLTLEYGRLLKPFIKFSVCEVWQNKLFEAIENVCSIFNGLANSWVESGIKEKREFDHIAKLYRIKIWINTMFFAHDFTQQMYNNIEYENQL